MFLSQPPHSWVDAMIQYGRRVCLIRARNPIYSMGQAERDFSASWQGKNSKATMFIRRQWTWPWFNNNICFHLVSRLSANTAYQAWHYTYDLLTLSREDYILHVGELISGLVGYCRHSWFNFPYREAVLSLSSFCLDKVEDELTDSNARWCRHKLQEQLWVFRARHNISIPFLGYIFNYFTATTWQHGSLSVQMS